MTVSAGGRYFAQTLREMDEWLSPHLPSSRWGEGFSLPLSALWKQVGCKGLNINPGILHDRKGASAWR
ncbi:MAG: hypothetical protein COX20_02125 [Desulfobacterales bacterium CG23_combo_of_CG06-09_8_20_14_all_52_9]|nr:MAG: hypothetical protein COX20_02125 [Desulfobacterales bacterium CG23_combo_of_CG06-09_8_20_14_all_52_9]